MVIQRNPRMASLSDPRMRAALHYSRKRRLARIAASDVTHALGPIFSGGTLGFVLDPTMKSTLWQDTAKTIPVSVDNDPVRVVTDAIGGTIEFEAVDDSVRPIWRENGGKSYLEFTGINSLDHSGTQLNYSSISVHVRANSLSDGRVIVAWPHAASHSSPYFRVSMYHGIADINESRLNGIPYSAGVVYGALNKKMVGVSSETGKFWIDGVSSNAGIQDPITYPNSRGVIIGSNVGGGEKFFGRMYGLVIIDRSTTSDDANLLNTWNTDP